MKSKPYALYVVLGAAAVMLWFIAQSMKGPADRRAVPFTPSSPPTLSDSPLPAAIPSLANAPGAASGTPGAPAPIGNTPVKIVSATGAAAKATSSPPNTGETGAANQAAQIDVGRVRHMVSDYHTLMGENPVGTNAEIMKQMAGGNSHQATLGPPEGMSLNAQGELIDQWGTPYFFHQLSRDRMEVRSAGPDKVMWTADDIVTR